MRITILANRDLPSNYALNMLIGLLKNHKLTIFLSDRVGKKDDKHPSLQQLEFFEQTLFLKALYPSGSRRDRRLLGFDELSDEYGCSVETLNRINAGADFKRFVETEPELVVTLRYGVILKEQVISIPKFGVINLHSGLLPAYKGVMATFRALLNEEKVIGTTLHYIEDSSIDQGPVIGTTRLFVNNEKSYLWHVIRLYPDACMLIEQTVTTIERVGRADSIDQSATGNYFSFPTDTELKDFEQKGLKLFDGDEMLDLADEFFSFDEV